MDNTALSVGVAGAMTLLRFIGDWVIFIKAGKPGWHSIIPLLHMYDEYDICWKGGKGLWAAILLCITSAAYGPTSESGPMLLIPVIAALWYMILEFRESMKLSRSFGKGGFFGLFLFIFGGLGRIILGLGSSRYIGKS